MAANSQHGIAASHELIVNAYFVDGMAFAPQDVGQWQQIR